MTTPSTADVPPTCILTGAHGEDLDDCSTHDHEGICVECGKPAGSWGTLGGRPYCETCGEDFLSEVDATNDANVGTAMFLLRKAIIRFHQATEGDSNDAEHDAAVELAGCAEALLVALGELNRSEATHGDT